uniref:Cadmium/zinc-transporting ATPase HMA2 n=1 Tax=Anthurium amnicola TaxID=1678845 RepID=A0A1D1YBN6_9ARAE
MGVHGESHPSLEPLLHGVGEEGESRGQDQAVKYQKSYFDVLRICCPSEVPLIEKNLHPLEGVVSVSVIVPSRTVIVVHDSALLSQLEIVKALNQARLEANVRAYGGGKGVRHWPSPFTIASGVFLAVSFLNPVYRPLQWLAVAAVAAGIPPMLLRALAAIRRLTLDINMLMLISVAGAMALRDYSEAGAIVFLFTIAEWLESRASYKATAVMSVLTSMAPQKAILAETGEVVDANNVKVNTVLAVKAGEIIPIDGIVLEGWSEVDESSLTGEPFPVPKQLQSQVWAGTLNINGYISVKTTALAENSAVAKMTKLVEEALNSKSGTQRIIDTCAKYYTPAVVLIAVLIAVIPAALKVHNVKHWFRLSLVLLVSGCPCGLVLSTPVATFCALTSAAKTGLLVKGGDFLESLAKTKVVAFDKTGTITRGEFTVMDFLPIGNDISMQSLLYWVSSIENMSSHPMAAALADYACFNSIEPKSENVSQFCIFPGEGIYGEIDGMAIYIGNQRIATRAGCATVPDVGKEMKGVTVVYVFSGAAPIGIFSLSDMCRTGAADSIRRLKHMGIKTAMVTGDSSASAMFAQNKLGNALDMVHAELLPEDKVRIIRELKTKEGSTVMVGDGMNDAAALAMADVGISMGISGSAVAMETSHITLMSNDIRKIPEAIRLGWRTHYKIIQNIIMSVVPKVAIVALAFAGHPLLWAAILCDVGTCLLVIFNSMLLLKLSNGKERNGRSSTEPCITASQKCCSNESGCTPCEDAGEMRAISQRLCDDSQWQKNKCCSNREPVVCHDQSHVQDQYHGDSHPYGKGGNACCSTKPSATASPKCCLDGSGCGAREDEGKPRAIVKCSNDIPHQPKSKCCSNREPAICHSQSHGKDHEHDHSHHHEKVENACCSTEPCVTGSKKCCSNGSGCGAHEDAGGMTTIGQCSKNVAHRHKNKCCSNKEPAVCHGQDHEDGHSKDHEKGGNVGSPAKPCVGASMGCCSNGSGCGACEDAGERRAIGKCSSDVYQHKNNCCSNREPNVCHGQSHGQDHDRGHSDHHEKGGNACLAGPCVTASDKHIEKDGHCIWIVDEAGHHGDCCIPTPAECPEEEHGKEMVVHDISSNEEYDIEQQHLVSCEKPTKCSSACCKSRKSPVAACCQSSSPGCKRSDPCSLGGGSSLLQLEEIVTE